MAENTCMSLYVRGFITSYILRTVQIQVLHTLVCMCKYEHASLKTDTKQQMHQKGIVWLARPEQRHQLLHPSTPASSVFAKGRRERKAASLLRRSKTRLQKAVWLLKFTRFSKTSLLTEAKRTCLRLLVARLQQALRGATVGWDQVTKRPMRITYLKKKGAFKRK